MFKTIQKRDGREVPFDETKITDAIFKAARAVGGEDRQTAMELTIEVLKLLKKKYNGSLFGVEDVQDIVEKVLIEAGHARTAKAYILYRDKRTRMRDAKGELMDAVEEILEETNRENANISNSPSAKMLQIASAASKKYYLTRLIPEEISQAHLRGDIHIHDLDFYGKTLTCVPDFEYTLIRDSQGEVRRVKFDFFNSLIDRDAENVSYIEGAEVLNLDGIQILGRNGWTKINKVMRRKLRTGECLYRINTRKGLPLHLTGEHKIPVLRNGHEFLVQVKEIEKKDRLLTSRQEFEDSLEPSVIAVNEINGYDRYVFDLETAEHWFTVNDYVVHNCLQIPLNKLLSEGFNTGHGYIRPPKRPISATSRRPSSCRAPRTTCTEDSLSPFLTGTSPPLWKVCLITKRTRPWKP
jgi:ribonucleoside-triphosphate reductase